MKTVSKKVLLTPEMSTIEAALNQSIIKMQAPLATIEELLSDGEKNDDDYGDMVDGSIMSMVVSATTEKTAATLYGYKAQRYLMRAR